MHGTDYAGQWSRILFPAMPTRLLLLEDSDPTKDEIDYYFNYVMDKFEKHEGEQIRKYITEKVSYTKNDFITEYNSYKGNAYGLANTLSQTANLKPKIVNKHLDNLFYSGQLTVPGPGVPPSIISGNVVANYVMNHMSK